MFPFAPGTPRVVSRSALAENTLLALSIDLAAKHCAETGAATSEMD